MLKNKFLKLSALASAAALSAGSALAVGPVIDTTPALDGISSATAAVVAVLGAMITMYAVIFGVRKVLGLIRGG
jgi:hypothetical protein